MVKKKSSKAKISSISKSSRLSRFSTGQLLVFAIFFAAIGGVLVWRSYAETIYYSPGQTYSYAEFPESPGYESMEWTLTPIVDPPASLTAEKLLHYYAFQFAMTGATQDIGGGYAGFMTSGQFNGVEQGKIINYSIWGSNLCKSDYYINPSNGESGGCQIAMQYHYKAGHKYKFQIKQGPSGVEAEGKWWGLWVTDLGEIGRYNPSSPTFVGEQRLQTTINGVDSTLFKKNIVFWGEDLHWWRTYNGVEKYTDCKSFEKSSMMIDNISANDETVVPSKFTIRTNSGKTNTGSNGFVTVNCPVTLVDQLAGMFQHNLGYWDPAAPDYSPLPSDRKAPSKPAGLKLSESTSSSITLAWTKATDNVGVATYIIYRGHTQIGKSTTNSFTESGLVASTSYSYTVEARDAVGNVSIMSDAFTASTPGKRPAPQ